MAQRYVTRDRETAYRQVINTWLKAQPGNMAYAQEVIWANKRRQATNKDQFGSCRDNPEDIRVVLNLPNGLYYTLVNFERLHGEGRQFLATKEDAYWFAKKFPQFCSVERI